MTDTTNKTLATFTDGATCECCGPNTAKVVHTEAGSESERGAKGQGTRNACDCGCEETPGCECGCECCAP